MKLPRFCLWALIFLLLFSGCQKSDEGEKPQEARRAYLLNGISIQAIDSLLGDSDKPLESGEAAPEGSAEGVSAIAYDYQLSVPDDTIRQYAQQLTAEDGGFQAVDENRCAAPLPSFDKGEGALRLAKAAEAEGGLIEVGITWSKNACTISISQIQGVITQPQPQPETKASDEPTSDAAAALIYFEGLAPETLGLEGSSMSEYLVSSTDGRVYIDENLCYKFSVYKKADGKGITQFAGTFYLTINQAHLYKQEPDLEAITEITPS